VSTLCVFTGLADENSAAMGKEFRGRYRILKGVLTELGMVK